MTTLGTLRLWRAFQYPTIPPSWEIEGTDRTREEIVEELGNPPLNWIYCVFDMDNRKMWFDIRHVCLADSQYPEDYTFKEGNWKHITCWVDGVQTPRLFVDKYTAIDSVTSSQLKQWLADMAAFYETDGITWETYRGMIRA